MLEVLSRMGDDLEPGRLRGWGWGWGFGRELSCDVAEWGTSTRGSTFSLPWWT